jgi:hypothetical protein
MIEMLTKIERSAKIISLAGRLGTLQSTLMVLAEQLHLGTPGIASRFRTVENEMLRVRFALAELRASMESNNA